MSGRRELATFADDALAVGFGISFPAVFFVLAALGVLETDTAFRIARWSGLGLIGFYGWAAGRLAGQRPAVCVLQGLAVAALGGAADRRQGAHPLRPGRAAIAGIAALTRVPLPGGLSSSKLPPIASTRSRRPWRPELICLARAADAVVDDRDLEHVVARPTHVTAIAEACA